MTSWYDMPVCVPFGNPAYDSGLGGSHDMDVQTAPNTPITSIVAGTITDLSAPSWGKQVCLKLDSPPSKDVNYFAYLHLAAINPVLRLGAHIGKGDIIGWSGGCTSAGQYGGSSNPTGQNFLNSPDMSSQPQTGIALMRGPVYGTGAGWAIFPPIDHSLDPTSILDAARNGTPDIDYRTPQLEAFLQAIVPCDLSFGIPKEWMRQALAGNELGPALTGEIDKDHEGKPLTDWQGNPIRVTFYPAGRIEFNVKTGVAHTYMWGK